jgi:hypothetical protein
VLGVGMAATPRAPVAQAAWAEATADGTRDDDDDEEAWYAPLPRARACARERAEDRWVAQQSIVMLGALCCWRGRLLATPARGGAA